MIQAPPQTGNTAVRSRSRNIKYITGLMAAIALISLLWLGEQSMPGSGRNGCARSDCPWRWRVIQRRYFGSQRLPSQYIRESHPQLPDLAHQPTAQPSPLTGRQLLAPKHLATECFAPTRAAVDTPRSRRPGHVARSPTSMDHPQHLLRASGLSQQMRQQEGRQ